MKSDTEQLIRAITGIVVAYEFQFTKRMELKLGEQGVVPSYLFTIATRGKDFEECLEKATKVILQELREGGAGYRMTFCRSLQ